MADVLLTHSYHLAYDRKQVRKMQPYPPLGTLFAASALRERGISVAVFDSMLQDPDCGFPEALQRHRPKIVAIYEDDFNFLSKMCLTRMRELAWQLAAASRAAGAVVISHGSDATDHVKEYLLHGSDFVLLGESETALAELCSAYLSGKNLMHVAGLMHLDAVGAIVGRAAKADPSHWISNSIPARDLIDLEPYRRAWKESHGYFSLNLVASRGCPYRCNWCAKPISGNRFQVRPPQVVADELYQLAHTYGAEHAWFGDDVFALDHRWVREFAAAVEKKKVRLPFKIQTRADLLSAETVEALRRAGCHDVWMGVESGSQRVLDNMDKGLRLDKVYTARQRLANSGIRACYFLQFGYPGETWDDIQATVALVRDTRPDDIGVSLSYPLPNTRFYERVRESLGHKRNWVDSDDLCVMFKGTYTDQFYLAVRDALHAEVDARNSGDPGALGDVYRLWVEVVRREPLSRNSDPTLLADDHPVSIPRDAGFVNARTLSAGTEA